MFNAIQNKVAGAPTVTKKEPVRSVADEKKEKMKNALFAGIATKKEDDDSDND